MPRSVINRAIDFIVFTTDLAEMMVQACRDAIVSPRYGGGAVLSVYLRQVFFTGLESLRIILLTSLVIGTVVISQIFSLIGTGSGYVTGRVMAWVVVREMAPLLTALIVTARSGSAIAAELSQMKISGETESLELLGIPIARYLVMPRIFGMATALLMLSIYFSAGAVAGGFLVSSLGWNLSFEQYKQGIFAALTMDELIVALVKALLFGLAISAISCRQGLMVGHSATQIPQATSRAVMQSLLAVFVLDGIVALGYLLIV